MSKNLKEIIEQITVDGGKNAEECDIEETLTYYTDGKDYGDYHCAFVDGYTGSEGEGEQIDFICRVNDDFFNVTGYYSSWDGGSVEWGDAVQVWPEETEVTIRRTLYKNSKGNVCYTKDIDLT